MGSDESVDEYTEFPCKGEGCSNIVEIVKGDPVSVGIHRKIITIECDLCDTETAWTLEPNGNVYGEKI